MHSLSHELTRALSEADSLKDDLIKQLDASRQECDDLIEELDAARRRIDSLQTTAHPARAFQGNQSAEAGASTSAEAADRPSPAPPGRLWAISAALATSKAALQACLDADSDPAVDFEQASEEERGEMREIHRRAATLAMHGMALMQTYYGALLPSMMTRVYGAAWRPTKAGRADASADSLVPAIARVHLRRPWLQAVLTDLWLIGATCFLTVVFHRFEAGSAQEWLASSATVLTLPAIICTGAGLNAKTIRTLLKQFQTLYVLVNVIGFFCLILFLFRDHPAKLLAFTFMVPSYAMSGFLDAFAEGGRVLNSRIFFVCNIAYTLAILALVSFKLGAFTAYTFELSTFTFVASSACLSAWLRAP